MKNDHIKHMVINLIHYNYYPPATANTIDSAVNPEGNLFVNINGF